MLDGLFDFAPWIYGVAVVAVGAAATITKAVFGKSSKQHRIFKDGLKALRSRIHNVERIDASVEALLTRFGVPMAFADLVGDVIQSSAKTILALTNESERAMWVVNDTAVRVAQMPSSQQAAILPNLEIPKDPMELQYAVGRVINEAVGWNKLSQLMQKARTE